MTKKAKHKDKKQECKKDRSARDKDDRATQEMTIGITLCQTIRNTNRRAD